MLRMLAALLALSALLPWRALAQAGAGEATSSPGLARHVLGGAEDYAAQPGDSLTSIGARFGVDVPVLARANGLRADARLQIGDVLRVEYAHIVPSVTDDEAQDAILVNVPQRMLFLIRNGEPARGHPVGAGRPTWRTPLGEFEIDEKAVDKPWYVPRSIQEEMRKEGKPVLTIVPPGPENPLGRHWLGLSRVDCGIHATNAPTSVYALRTHGCIRQHPDDAAALYERVSVGERVRIVYEPVLIAALPDGRVCAEAHRDAYRLGRAEDDRLGERIEAAGLGPRVDRARLDAVLAAREGIAREVTTGSNGGVCR